MSHIFDGLLRSEGERAGVDVSGRSVAIDLLKTTARAGQDAPLQAVPQLVVAVEPPIAGRVLQNDKHPDLIGHFQSLQVTLPPQNHLVCLGDNESLAAEKFRFLGMQLRHLRRARPLKSVLITSTIPREGKSTVAANLACTLARKKQ